MKQAEQLLCCSYSARSFEPDRVNFGHQGSSCKAAIALLSRGLANAHPLGAGLLWHKPSPRGNAGHAEREAQHREPAISLAVFSADATTLALVDTAPPVDPSVSERVHTLRFWTSRLRAVPQGSTPQTRRSPTRIWAPLRRWRSTRRRRRSRRWVFRGRMEAASSASGTSGLPRRRHQPETELRLRGGFAALLARTKVRSR